MESKLVSVIIPTYNRSYYLKQAISSVLSQTYTNFELLILDNYSTDNTPEIVAQFDDVRIKYLRHQCNIQSLANWSYGVYWAKGEYLCILGDDDFYTPAFISSRVATFDKFENIAGVFSNYDICNSKGDIQGINPLIFDHEYILSGKELLKCAVDGWFIGATLYKSEIVQRLFDRVTMAGKALDTFLNINISIAGHRVVWINSKGIIYRWHDNQDTVNNTGLVLIGHVLACSLPFMFDECYSYREVLAKSSTHALEVLAQDQWSKKRYKLARRFVKMELVFNVMKFKTWFRLLRYCIPIQRFRSK